MSAEFYRGWITLPKGWLHRAMELKAAGVTFATPVSGADGVVTYLDCLVPAVAFKLLDTQWGECFWSLHPCLPDGALDLSGIAACLQDAYHLFLEVAPRPGLYRAFEGDREHGGLKGRCLAYEQALADVERIRELDASAFHDIELLPMDRINTEVELVTNAGCGFDATLAYGAWRGIDAEKGFVVKT